MTHPDEETTYPAPGVTRQEYDWGYILIGRKENLIAAGLAQPHWFASGAGRDKRGRVIRKAEVHWNGHRIQSYSSATMKTYRLWVHHSDATRSRWRERRALGRAFAEERREIESLPIGHQQFREKLLSSANFWVGRLREHASSGSGGFRFAPEAIDCLDEIARQLLATLELGKTLFSPTERDAQIAAIKAKTAKRDEGLQKFLSDLFEGSEPG